MSEQHDCGGDAAAYVLGALNLEEASAFERHMAGCIVCRDEVATLAQVADALPMAAPQYEVPRSLRRRVMRGVRAEPRVAPASASASRRRRPQWPSRLIVPRSALAFGATAVIAAAIAGGVLLGSGGSNRAQVFRASVGDAEVRLAGGQAELIVNKLPAPQPGRIYEVWVKRAGHQAMPTGALFSVTSSGRSDVGLPGNLHGVGQVMVTSEPAGGSAVPTRPPVIVASLTKRT
jgi:anti-sigma factor RsiW